MIILDEVKFIFDWFFFRVKFWIIFVINGFIIINDNISMVVFIVSNFIYFLLFVVYKIYIISVVIL